MPVAKKVTAADVERFKTLRGYGMTLKQIGEATGFCHTTICKHLPTQDIFDGRLVINAENLLEPENSAEFGPVNRLLMSPMSAWPALVNSDGLSISSDELRV